MSLRHALLALVEVGPLTGYELAKVFDQSADHIWHAQHSQIYTELRRMEAEGLIAAQTLPRGANATKRAYGLTSSGANELVEWVSTIEEPPSFRDEAHLKATYFEYGSYSNARLQFRAHRAHYQRLRDQLERHVDDLERAETDLMQRRLQHAPAEVRQAIIGYKTHTYRGLIARARSEIEWAENGLRLVDTLIGWSADQGVDEPTYPPTPSQTPR
ncbi:MAG: PadR family transcriptional regulator [Rhodococcus sp. (in: high G+C Gram-positive bacteria)]|uniref:PadR family transcriptional regulator n=1 Tax=Rhodococcus sp. TaxID=1831 RepID=UPI002ADABBEF|nr:PadR family transcriptional regulator [Rhodococcus sp. (in: high G+C Gram-positive bacteria)]